MKTAENGHAHSATLPPVCRLKCFLCEIGYRYNESNSTMSTKNIKMLLFFLKTALNVIFIEPTCDFYNSK